MPQVLKDRFMTAFQRPVRACLVALMTLYMAASGLAQTPTKPLKLIVPFPAGGTADVLPRLLAEKMRAQFPAGVVVENKAGAGGNIGAEFVYRAEPDGSTILASPPGPVAINHHLYKKLSFDPTRWQAITVMATVPNVLAVSPKVPAKNLAELIAYMKANPGKVSYASQGNGSTSHLTASMFMQLTGTEMIHVPYKGSAPSITDLMGGQVQLTFEAIAIGLPHLKSGRLKALATTDNKRLTILPDLPTAAETVPGYVVKNWFGLAAPSGIPMDRVLLIQKVVSLVLQDPEVLKTLVDLGVEPIGDSPNQFGALVRQETERWQKLLQNSGIKSD